MRLEQGLLQIRAALDAYANRRSAVLGDVDVLIVRELVGWLHFGARGTREDGTVDDTCEYHPWQVERIVRRAFELARSRRRKLTSADGANVLEITPVAARRRRAIRTLRSSICSSTTPRCQLATTPEHFDVVITDNMFGDILSDLAAAATGGLGLAPSASLSDGGPGLFEPVHGSAPDLAGRNVANPTAMPRSAAVREQLAVDGAAALSYPG